MRPKSTLLRVALLLLAAVLVAATAWATTTQPYEAGRQLAAEEAAAKGKAPLPGSEAALRRGIGERLRGSRDAEQRDLAALGPLQSIGYLGGGRAGLLPGTGFRFDQFRLSFRSGTRIATVAPGKDGQLALRGFGSPDPPTPQQVIEGYGSFPASERAVRTLTQLGVLLATALFGRLALRLKL